MASINVEQQLGSNLDLFDNSNMQTIVARMNDYFQKTAINITVSNIKKVLDIDPVDVIITDFQYSNIDLVTNPILAYEQSVNNSDSKVAVDVAVNYSKTLEEVFSFSFNEGINVGVSVKVKAGLPVIGQSEVTVSGEASFEASQSWSKKESRTWEASNTIRIEAGDSADIKVTINNGKINSPFTAKILMGPQTWILYNVDSSVGATDVWVPITAVYTKEEVLNQLSIPVSGDFLGVEGVSVVTTVTPI